MQDNIRAIFNGALGLLSTVTAADLAIAQEAVDRAGICKAGIATVMGREPKIINIDKIEHDVITLSYRRPGEQKLWSYRCKIVGDRVIWAANPGRWREHPDDGRLTYRMDRTKVHVTEAYSDGSKIEKIFARSDLK